MGYHPLYALGTSLPRSTLSGDHGRSIYTIEFGKYYKPSLSPSSSESQLLNIYEHMTGYNAQNLVPQNRLLWPYHEHEAFENFFFKFLIVAIFFISDISHHFGFNYKLYLLK